MDDRIPSASERCEYCAYRNKAGKALLEATAQLKEKNKGQTVKIAKKK